MYICTMITDTLHNPKVHTVESIHRVQTPSKAEHACWCHTGITYSGAHIIQNCVGFIWSF